MGLFDELFGRAMDPEVEAQYDQMANRLIEKNYKGEDGLPVGRPARGEPALERAMSRLDKEFPREMVKVEAGHNPNLDMTNIAAQVPTISNKGNPLYQIEVNPTFATLAPMSLLEGTLAHELQHVRDVRSGVLDNDILKYSNLMPWEERSHEKRAMTAEDDYMKTRNNEPTSYDGTNQNVRNSFFNWANQSPAVKEWIDLLNDRRRK